MINFLRSLPRHFISAIVSLFRNFAMTFSSVFAVTITLMILSLFMLLIGNINNLSDKIQKDLKIHVVLNQDVINQEQIQQVENVLNGLTGVIEVQFSDKDNELQLMIKERGEELKMYENDNPLAHAFYVKVENSDNIRQIADTISTMPQVRDVEYGGNSVNRLVQTLNMVKIGGVGFLGLLTLLVLFLIHSTIKITIQAREVEIGIMRQVGAANWYIKVPFLIEGMIIGAIGAVLPCLFTYHGYQLILEKTGGYLISSMFTMIPFTPFVYKIMTLLLVIGVFVGFVGSFISTHKYIQYKR